MSSIFIHCADTCRQWNTDKIWNWKMIVYFMDHSSWSSREIWGARKQTWVIHTQPCHFKWLIPLLHFSWKQSLLFSELQVQILGVIVCRWLNSSYKAQSVIIPRTKWKRWEDIQERRIGILRWLSGMCEVLSPNIGSAKPTAVIKTHWSCCLSSLVRTGKMAQWFMTGRYKATM